MVIELLVICFVAIFFYYSLQLTRLAQDVTNVFAIPKRILYSCPPCLRGDHGFYSLRHLAEEVVGVISRPKI